MNKKLGLLRILTNLEVRCVTLPLGFVEYQKFFIRLTAKPQAYTERNGAANLYIYLRS